MPPATVQNFVTSITKIRQHYSARYIYVRFGVSCITQPRNRRQHLPTHGTSSRSFYSSLSLDTGVNFPRSRCLRHQLSGEQTSRLFFDAHTTHINPPSIQFGGDEEIDLGRPDHLHDISRSYFTPQQSSVGGWISLVALGAISSAYILYISYAEQSSSETSEQNSRDLESTYKEIQNWSSMTGESLPGRPGTLTAEQEEKLREFWIATLQVFGVLDESYGKDPGNNGTEPSTGTAPVVATEKPKKKKISLFSKKKDTDSDSVASAKSSQNPASTDDDKYGQTKQFHDTLANQRPEVLRATFWSMVKHDHPDALLLRFLRARKWDVEKALIMMVATMNWRASEMHVDDDIMTNGEAGALKDSLGSNAAAKQLGGDFLAQMRMGKSFLHGIDKEGRPMCTVRVRLHKQGEQSEESLERYTVYFIESTRMVLSPPIDTAVSESLKILMRTDHGSALFLI